MNKFKVLLLITTLLYHPPNFSKEVSEEDIVSLMKVSHLAGYCQAVFDGLHLSEKGDNKKAKLLLLKVYEYKAQQYDFNVGELTTRCNVTGKIHQAGTEEGPK